MNGNSSTKTNLCSIINKNKQVDQNLRFFLFLHLPSKKNPHIVIDIKDVFYIFSENMETLQFFKFRNRSINIQIKEKSEIPTVMDAE